MRLTVVMALRDGDLSQVEMAIRSIQNQTYRDFEFLILDDGGRSEHIRQLLEESARQDSRIRLYHEEGRGLTRSLNIGIERARGEWIARQDADDWSEPQRFEAQFDFLERETRVGLAGSAVWTHQHSGRRLWKVDLPRTHSEIRAAFPGGNPFVHGAVVFRRSAAIAIGGYREAFPCSQDYDFFWRLSERVETANLAEPLYHYRYNRGSVSARRAVDQASVQRAARLLAQERVCGEIEDVEAALATSNGRIEGFEALLKQADHRLLAGDYGAAVSEYFRLILERPASALAWGKLVRWGVFRALPPAREMCFRR